MIEMDVLDYKKKLDDKDEEKEESKAEIIFLIEDFKDEELDILNPKSFVNIKVGYF